MSAEHLEIRVDKFVFKVKQGYFYSKEGIWLHIEGDKARIGINDYKQQTIGDIGFVNLPEIGEELKTNDGLALIETIKTVLEILSPVNGILQEINNKLEDEPELINEDPYGNGWIAIIKLSNWEQDQTNLLTADAYLQVMRQQVEEGAKEL